MSFGRPPEKFQHRIPRDLGTSVSLTRAPAGARRRNPQRKEGTT